MLVPVFTTDFFILIFKQAIFFPSEIFNKDTFIRKWQEFCQDQGDERRQERLVREDNGTLNQKTEPRNVP